MDDTIALAALMQAIVVKLHKLLRQNVTFRIYPRRLIDENRWRAGRYGLDGKLIDFGRKCEMEERELLHEMLEFLAEKSRSSEISARSSTSNALCGKAPARIDRLTVWERTQDMKAVVDHIVAETHEGLEERSPSLDALRKLRLGAAS